MQSTNIIEPLVTTDRVITSFIHDILPRSPLFDQVFSFLSIYGNSVIVWGVLLLILILLAEKKHKKFIVYLFSGTIATFLLVELGLKNLYGRVRPLTLNETLFSVCPTGFSFPSGHAAVAFAAAFVFSHFDEKRSLIYYIIAFLISLSRIYLGCHYLVDIMAGAIVGVITAKIITSLLNKAIK